MAVTSTTETTWVSDADSGESITFDPGHGSQGGNPPFGWAYIIIFSSEGGSVKPVKKFIDPTSLSTIVGLYPGLG